MKNSAFLRSNLSSSWLKKRRVALMCCALFLPATSAHAYGFGTDMMAVQPSVLVEDIKVLGALRLERETVLSYLTIAKGDQAKEADLNASLKALYATGLFKDIKLALQNNTLVIQIDENPIINRISFEGNDKFSIDDLNKEVQLLPRHVYTLPKIQKDVQRLLALYRRSGRFAATVEPKLVKLDQNRVDIVFEIAEGAHTGVSRIQFIGNKFFDESSLSSVISTEETSWWDFFSSSDFYDPDRTEFDRELLRRFYLNEGYIDFRVVSAVAEMVPDRSDFFLTFTVDEGNRYKFGKIEIESELKGVDSTMLTEYLKAVEGNWYSADAVQASIAKMTSVLGDKQYAFVDIIPKTKQDKENQTVNVTFVVKPGEQVYIGRIDITGNTRTYDKVIRREMIVAESDPFSVSNIKRSEQKIKDLGYFADVKVSAKPGTQPDRSNVSVEVKEKSTGEVSFGAGFSSSDGPLGNFSISERNFLGKGQDVSLGATFSGSTKQFDFSFTEPYFMDRDLTAGVDVFHTRKSEQDESAYDEINTGFKVRMGYPLSEYIRQMVSYTLRQDKISNVSSTASRFIREQAGKSLNSMISQELTYDARDSKVEPRNGFVSKLKTDFAGIGGDKKYARVVLTGGQYYEIYDDYIVSMLGEVGLIRGLGQDVRINDRFFLGGETLRGFAYAGIGPRDLTGGADDALGGNSFARGSVEMSMPLAFMPDDMGVKGHVFSDFGVLGKNDDSPLPSEVFKSDNKPRASVGIGLSWKSPFGLIRLDYAQPLMKQSYDKTEFLHFSFGTRF